MIDILDFCWKTLHLYGKRADDFKALIPMYMEFLGGYPAKDVEGAFRKYVRHRSEFPTPSDIIGIIEGRVKRDGAYYTRLTRKVKEGAFLTDDELRYMRLYEAQVQDDWG